MVDKDFDDMVGDGIQPEADDDLKKKAAAQSTQASGLSPEDQSRGVLHYGETHEGTATSNPLPELTVLQENTDAPVADNVGVEDVGVSSDDSAAGFDVISGESDPLQPADLPPPIASDAHDAAQIEISPIQSEQADRTDVETATNVGEPGGDRDIGIRKGVESPEDNLEIERGQINTAEEATTDQEGHKQSCR